jgi:hypothetical protein
MIEGKAILGFKFPLEKVNKPRDSGNVKLKGPWPSK